MKKLYLIVLLAGFLFSCNKTEDVTIPGNTPPPDYTIDSSTIQLYINKAYINILGREPLTTEKTTATALLNAHNFSVTDRQQFIATITAKPDYPRNLYNVARIEYLQNLDSSEIESQIYLFTFLLSQPQYAPLYDVLHSEIDRMNLLKRTVNDMNNGTLDYRGMLKRCVNNYFYDQINMGSENFVVSTFQNFLFRYPTTEQLTNGKTMVDGLDAIFFLHTGNSKSDYIDIFFNSDDYYEGQVRNLFKKYLFREPNSAEIHYYAAIYKSTNEYKNLQQEVFATDEYAGL